MDFPPLPLCSDTQNGNPLDATGILDLPEKCVINIVKHVPLQNMDDIIELFPKWDGIVQEHIPVEVHLTDIGFRIAHHYFMGHEDLAKYRVKIIHSRVIDETLPDLKNPEDLEIAEFATHTELVTFKTIVAKSVNLQELHFGYGSLSGHKLSDTVLHLPRLKILNICDRPIDFKGGLGVLPKNMIGFLEKKFPSIESLSVMTSASKKWTIDYATALLTFIQNNSNSLKKIKFIVMAAPDSLLESADDENHLTPPENLDLEKLASVKLDSLELTLGHNCFVGLDQWMAILRSQENLATLQMGSEKTLPLTFYTAPVPKSSGTLVTLQLGVDIAGGTARQRNPFDCTILENCSILEKLSLTGPPFPESKGNRPPLPELVNLEKLPKRIRSLEIQNIYLETSQIIQIKEQLQKLDSLSLKNVGVTGLFGVPMSLLDSWIKSGNQKRIREIILRGVNGDDSKVYEFDHLVRLGMTSPLSKCEIHACYFPTLKEYRKPRPNEENSALHNLFQ